MRSAMSPGSLGQYSQAREEEEIRKVLAGQSDFDAVVRSVDEAAADDDFTALMADLDSAAAREATEREATDHASPEHGTAEHAAAGPAPADRAASVPPGPLYSGWLTFLREALEEYYGTPGAAPGGNGTGGVSWREHPGENIVEFTPPPDLRQRLEALPQDYLSGRQVLTRLKLATSPTTADELLRSALAGADGSSWPQAHWLGPLHPVLDWAADRALTLLGRNEVSVVRGAVDEPTVLVCGTLTDRRGQVVTASWIGVAFPDPDHPAFALATPYDSAAQMLRAAGIGERMSNPGPVPGVEGLSPLVRQAVERAREQMRMISGAAAGQLRRRIDAWNSRAEHWREEAEGLLDTGSLRRRRLSVEERRRLIEQMAPERSLVRPLLLVVPAGAGSGGSRTVDDKEA